MGATRTVALTELPFRGISVNDATDGSASVTVVASDSGVLFVNEYASATTYTLPTVALAKGKMFWFFNVGAGGIVLTGGTTDVMVGLNAAAADTCTFSTGSAMIGASAAVFCDGTYYFVMVFAGTAVYGG
jgi:hypothetical protein